MTQPVVYMIAGPNGAGKTSSAMRILPDFLSVYEFVNADEIARGLNPLNADGQAMAAGRLMLERMERLINERKSFAFETTGSSRMFAAMLRQAQQYGYRLGLVYLWLPNSEFAKHRVRLRVRQGGHNIPEETIERRYERGLSNLVHLYLPLMDHAVIVDSTMPITGKPETIAKKLGMNWTILKPQRWRDIERAAEGVEGE